MTSASYKNVSGKQNPTEVQNVTTLLEVSQALLTQVDLQAGLRGALEKLEQHLRIRGATVTLLDAERREVSVQSTVGSSTEGHLDRARPGEGITGRVIEKGKEIIVPQVSKEPLLIDSHKRKGQGGRELTFMCVPIVLDRKPAGALCVDLEYKPQRDYEGFVRLLRVVASMIAQALKVHRIIESEKQRLVDENIHLKQELKQRYDLSSIVGTSGPMRQAYSQVVQVAPANTTVLIRGESGTGKELFAQAIHYNSPRAKKPFVKVSCAALPDTLIESELFGYEKGAFTGAESRKQGRFELADGGTLFLDEVGELNLQTQVKLLRVLQEREFERLGGIQPLKVNVRLIAATNMNLEEAIAERSFREDFYYRLNVFSIFVPPLRERRSDIMLLADHFLTKYARQHGKDIKRISTPAIDMLVSYHWPGNVRELENTLERAVVVCESNVIHAHNLPPTLQTAEASGTQMTTSLEEAVKQYERDLILDALKTTRGNQAKAARLLSSTERIINYKIKRFGIDRSRFRP
jgi:Nif-specific regulatory protein